MLFCIFKAFGLFILALIFFSYSQVELKPDPVVEGVIPLSNEEFSQIQTALSYRRQDCLIEDAKIRDLEKEELVKADNSHALPPRKHPDIQFIQLCKQLPSECPPPYSRTLISIVAAPKYKLAACLVQKTASTAMYGTLCYLRNETAFKVAGRNILKEYGHLIFCHGQFYPTYEKLEETFGSLQDWKVLFVKRDPLDRFLSGYLDLCLRRGECLQCWYNMTCFMEKLHKRILTYDESASLSELDMHMFPQTWQCDSIRHSSNFTYIRYSTNSSKLFLPDLVSILQQQKVPPDSIESITAAFTKNRTAHSTVTSSYREILEARLLSSPYLLELLVKMFYYDFEHLSLEFPK